MPDSFLRPALPTPFETFNHTNSSQELPSDAAELLKSGVDINACSLSQLRQIADEAPGSSVGVRFNPGLGSGGTKSTNVGGPSSSFGAGLFSFLFRRRQLGWLSLRIEVLALTFALRCVRSSSVGTMIGQPRLARCSQSHVGYISTSYIRGMCLCFEVCFGAACSPVVCAQVSGTNGRTRSRRSAPLVT